MLAVRSIVDAVLYSEKQRTSPEFRVFDTSTFPVDLALPSRLYRPGEMVSVVTCHVTDVDGGYGVSKRQVAAARKLIEHGKVPAEIALQLPFDIDDASYMLALLIRYSGAAYHRLASRRVGDVINHPLTLRTSHGNGGNMGPGWACDCGSKERLSPELAAAGIASLSGLVRATFERTGHVVVLVPHRVWSSQRLGDTGSIVWRTIVLAVVEDLGRDMIVVGYNTRGGTGRYISTTFDPSALYDDRGRKLAA